MNLWIRGGGSEDTEGSIVNLGGKNTVMMRPGDKIVIQTPGGGGYGCASEL